jgi:hypothetical protein
MVNIQFTVSRQFYRMGSCAQVSLSADGLVEFADQSRSREVAVMPDERATVGGTAMAFRNLLNDFWNRTGVFSEPTEHPRPSSQKSFAFWRSRDCAQSRRSRDAMPSLCSAELSTRCMVNTTACILDTTRTPSTMSVLCDTLPDRRWGSRAVCGSFGT